MLPRNLPKSTIDIIMTSETMPEGETLNLAELAPPNITAAVFDMDDLMINSHPLHMKVFEAVLQGYDVDIHDPSNPWTAQDEASMFGLKISDAFKLFISRYGLEAKADPETMRQQFDDRMLPVFEGEPIEPMPGLTRLLATLSEHNLRLALASSAKRQKIDVILTKLGLEDVFEVVVSGEDEIKHGKPAPDIFLEAARKLGKEPSECIVFEDAKNGIEAARAAGMFAVGVHNKFAEQRLDVRQDLSEANLQSGSLEQLTYH